MRIACITYRKWALDIYDRLAESSDHTFLIIRSRAQYSDLVIKDFKPDIILFYGWSWLVSQDITKNFKCIMLHPAPLPKYRGGSPIQNQIIAGEKTSAITLFFMLEEMDAGDIIAQEPFSLQGTLGDILNRITEIGYRLTVGHILTPNKIVSVPQKHSDATYCKRRKPSDSEITLNEITNESAEYLYNKIRMLADPYPNAYIKSKDGKNLYIKDSYIE
jgi:methionyl-tRNA formyltransferase